MNWDTPAKTKWFAGAAAAVLIAGLMSLHRDRPPSLAAADSGAADDSGMRDALASPTPIPGGAGWLQTATGAAFLSRAARNPSLLSRLKEARPPLRATSGRRTFGGKRVIMGRVKPGIPEPTLAVGP